MSKQTHLTVRLAASEARALQAAADADGVSVSRIVREAIKRRFDVTEAAAAASKTVADALRSDFQVHVFDLDSKLRLVSDQIAALSKIVTEARK
jgi:hypothetical protein